MAAQPFDDGEHQSEKKNARRARAPSQHAEHRARGIKKPQPTGHQHGNERKLPGVRVGIDQEGVADPIEPDEKKAEAEAPANSPCLTQAAWTRGCAIQQQHEARIRKKQKRK